MHSVVCVNSPTREKLRIAVAKYGIILTADDFGRNEDEDFTYHNEWNNKCIIYRECIPEEVVEILDAVIDEKEAVEEAKECEA